MGEAAQQAKILSYFTEMHRQRPFGRMLGMVSSRAKPRGDPQRKKKLVFVWLCVGILEASL
jgi:hypothetical protein